MTEEPIRYWNVGSPGECPEREFVSCEGTPRCMDTNRACPNHENFPEWCPLKQINEQVPQNCKSCQYIDENNDCGMMKREERIIGHKIPTQCNGWCLNIATEKGFQHVARQLSGRKIE